MTEELFHLQNIDPEILVRERDNAVLMLRQVIGNIPIKEIGSTAISGMIGKGDVDLLIAVKHDEFAAIRAKLDSVFERDTNQLSNEAYQAFVVPSPLDIKAQLTIEDGPYNRFDAFLEVLQNNSIMRDRYEALKRSMNGKPMRVYRRAKAKFIQDALRD